jgi:hypothetical protein
MSRFGLAAMSESAGKVLEGVFGEADSSPEMLAFKCVNGIPD